MSSQRQTCTVERDPETVISKARTAYTPMRFDFLMLAPAVQSMIV